MCPRQLLRLPATLLSFAQQALPPQRWRFCCWACCFAAGLFAAGLEEDRGEEYGSADKAENGQVLVEGEHADQCSQERFDQSDDCGGRCADGSEPGVEQ